jgi:GT2 family glycosyltransferase
VSDGGSTDGTVAAIKTEFPDVVVLTTEVELWWAGSMAAGIDYALEHSQHGTDFVLMMNNDTEIPQNYVATLVNAAREFDAAVGALIVDSKDSSRILDAGEYVDWSSYAFPVKANIDAWERFRDDVDVLPGRGSLVPLEMIREVGNVDVRQFPHYLADYEFFYRLKRNGFRLGVCYDTSVSAHIDETGIVPSSGVTSFRQVWTELFSRRSMANVIDHWRFVTRHAPKKYRVRLQLRLIARAIAYLGLRTPLRPVALPFYWIALLPSVIVGQIRAFRRFNAAWLEHGQDVWCHPSLVPGSIRVFAYLLLSPGPVHVQDCRRCGTNPDDLVRKGVLMNLPVADWFAFSTLAVPQGPASALLRDSRNLWAKVRRTLTVRKASRAAHAKRSNG